MSRIDESAEERIWQQPTSSHRHLPAIVCPFCDHRVRSSEVRKKAADEPPSVQVVRCRNCGEAFEAEEDYESEYL